MFTCKGCREVTRLVGEVEDFRPMMESMKRIVTGLGLEEKGEETGDRMAELGETEKCEEVITPDNSTEGNRKGKATAGSISSEDRDTVTESEVEHVTEGEDTSRQLIRSGTQFLATHRYEKNPDGPVGNELYLNEGDTVVYLMKNDDNEHWWLVEDGKGQVGYVPAAYLMIIVDETPQEEENDTNRRDGHERRADGTKIGGEMGQDGERRKKYSAAVIDVIKRKSRIFVGDSIVRKTDSRLNKGEGGSVFTGSKDRACDRESREDHGKRKGRDHTGTHIGTNNADKEGTTAIVDKYMKLLKKTKEARVEQIILSGILPVFGNRIDGYRNSKRMAINGMVKRLCKEEEVGYVDMWDSFVGKEEMYVRDGLDLSGKGAAVFAEGLSGAVASGLGKVRYLN